MKNILKLTELSKREMIRIIGGGTPTCTCVECGCDCENNYVLNTLHNINSGNTRSDTRKAQTPQPNSS